MLGQVLPIDAGLVVVALDMGVGREPAEVLVAGPVLRQEDEVERLGVCLAFAVPHAPPSDVRLDAEDRLDARRGARLVERDRAVEGPMVGQGEAVEAVSRGRVDELRDPPQAIEKTELRVDVEVGEVVRRQGRHGTSMVAGEDGLRDVSRFAVKAADPQR